MISYPRAHHTKPLLVFIVFIVIINEMTHQSILVSSANLDSPELKYRIEEELDSGTYIGNVINDAHLVDIYGADTMHKLQFQFLKAHKLTSGGEGGFMVDNSTGIIRSHGRVDRESVCPSAIICDIRADVAVQPVEYFKIIRITISILDINDNWPVFGDRQQVVEILESAQIDTVLFIPEAIDLDGPSYSIQNYELFSDSDRFVLTSPARNADGTFSTKLVIAKELDREASDKYNIHIVAVDGGTPPKTGSVGLTIYVLDVNDNSPEFHQIAYEVTIDENFPSGTPVARVRAHDNDLGLNGAVLYGFDLQTITSYGDLFTIDNTTGEIFAKSAVDYERSPFYKLGVTAKDRGTDTKPVSAVVSIHVNDLNDNAPQIVLDTLSGEIGVSKIRENVALGTFVGHVTISDLDSGRNGEFRCGLNDPSFRLVSMYDTEFQIVTAADLDREAKSEYNLTLTCKDLGSEPQTTSKMIRVKVVDANDNSPVFQQDNYRGDLTENNFVGASIITVVALDADADGPNGKVIYSLQDEFSHLFHIDPESGLITGAVSFDREKNDVIRFQVVARDQGEEPRSSTAQVIFTVIDVNDEQPVFSQPSYAFSVGENLREGTVVGSVAARDADTGVYGEIIYSIYPTSPFFRVNQKTGEITTASVLDREESHHYHLIAMASDRGVPSKSSSVNVTITILDVNDHPPVFDFPTTANNTVQVSTRAPVGYTVTRLKAHDLDHGRNAKIVYTMSSVTSTNVKSAPNDTLGYFDLDPEWGTLMVGRDLSEINGRRFRFEFRAKDQGPEPKTSQSAYLHVIVNQSAPLYLGRNGEGAAIGWLSITQNVLIVLAIAIGSAIIIVILIIAIIFIRRRYNDLHSDKSGQMYNCRAEEAKMLSKEGAVPGFMFSNEDGRAELGDNDRYVTCNGRGQGYPGISRDGTAVDFKSPEYIQKLPFEPSSRLNVLQDQLVSRSMVNFGSTSRGPNEHDLSHGYSQHRLHSPDGDLLSFRPKNKDPEDKRLMNGAGGGRGDEEGSDHSGEGSNADSGRGVSEEGENGILVRQYSVKQQQQREQHLLHQQQQLMQQLQQVNSLHVGSPVGAHSRSLSFNARSPRSQTTLVRKSSGYDMTFPTVTLSDGPYYHDDMVTIDHLPAPRLSPGFQCHSSNHLGPAVVSQPTYHRSAQQINNTYGSTGILHRPTTIDPTGMFYPDSPAVIPSAVNDRFIVNTTAPTLGTPPRSGRAYHLSPLPPRVTSNLPLNIPPPPGSRSFNNIAYQAGSSYGSQERIAPYSKNQPYMRSDRKLNRNPSKASLTPSVSFNPSVEVFLNDVQVSQDDDDGTNEDPYGTGGYNKSMVKSNSMTQSII